MKKLNYYLGLLAICLFFSCEKEDNTINYPAEGVFGINILSNDSIEIDRRKVYSMRADVPEDASISIVMHLSGAGVFSINNSSMNGWMKFPSVNSNYFQYTAIGQEVCDAAIEFYDRGKLEIEIYENGSNNPTRNKTLSW